MTVLRAAPDRRRVATRFLLGVLAVLGFGTPVFYVESTPILEILPDDVYWLINRKTCPATARLVELIEDDASLRRRVILLPTSLQNGEVSEASCRSFMMHFSETGHWLRWIPTGYLCDRAAREATLMYELEFVASPAWLYKSEPLPASIDAEVLFKRIRRDQKGTR